MGENLTEYHRVGTCWEGTPKRKVVCSNHITRTNGEVAHSEDAAASSTVFGGFESHLLYQCRSGEIGTHIRLKSGSLRVQIPPSAPDGGLAERTKAAVLKTVEQKLREFESHTLRQRVLLSYHTSSGEDPHR